MELKENLKGCTTRSGAEFNILSKVSDLRGGYSMYAGNIVIDENIYAAEWSMAGVLKYIYNDDILRSSCPNEQEIRDYSLVLIEKL